MTDSPRSRRRFLAETGLTLGSLAAVGTLADEPRTRTIVDTHTHFYDPSRPGGVPWPPKGSTLDRTVLPKHYRAERVPEPVTGTVVVEASERLEDNQWILDLAKDDPFIVGFVGRLDIRDEQFPAHLERFAANPLFRGIRIRPDDVAAALDDRRTGRHLALLAEKDLAIDVLGNRAKVVRVPELAKRLPDLRIVVDHMGNPNLASEPDDEWREWQRMMAAFEKHANVSCKVSGLVEAASRGGAKAGESPTDVDFYRPTLDHLWRTFGEDRVIYGSNWPVCERGGSLYAVQKLATDYFATKGEAALAKYLAGNAKTVYKWLDR